MREGTITAKGTASLGSFLCVTARFLLLITVLCFITACGGGGSSSSGQATGTNPPPPPPPPQQPDTTSIDLRSESGDYIGGGQDYSYTQADAQITVSSEGALVDIYVDGDENWFGRFKLPDSYTLLEPGTYEYPPPEAGAGGFSWTGEHRGCNGSTGSITIDFVSYEGPMLTSISLTFEQHCEGATPALFGEIHWNASDATSPPGPVVPPPDGLWEPAPGVTPASGNYVYLESQQGDYIANGTDHVYTPANSLIAVTAWDNEFSITVDGDERWRGSYQGKFNQSSLEAGYYGDLQRFQLHNPAKGGLLWSGNGRNCNDLNGWFVVDGVTYDGEALVAIELRFEQYCDSSTGALRGEIRWDATDTTGVPGPEVPPPPGLWAPVPGATPASGSYVYLESESGDYVGDGGAYLYDQAVADFRVDVIGNYLSVAVEGDEFWVGRFEGMYSLSQIEPGYYGEMQRFGSHNPAKGGLLWYGEGRTCAAVSGWFVVDEVTYNGATIESIKLRFEQYCDDGAAALHGEVQWDASDPTSPPGPTVPPPASLWEPAPGTTPQSGNYVYLESEPGDVVGEGGSYLHTQADAILVVNATNGNFTISVNGDRRWHGSFQAMDGLDQLALGYYGDLQRFQQHNPVKGGLNWGGGVFLCQTLTGWFVVDSVSYDGETLTSIDLRFGQHCNGDAPALFGKVHWDIDDVTSPPSPVVPPAGLWEPPPGATPSSGIYIYLESESGDYIGEGKTNLYVEGDGRFLVESTDAHLHVEFTGNENWTGDFEGMNFLSRLEVGYYGDLQRWPFHNPVKGGLNWVEVFRGCATQDGWFVVDSVTYEGRGLTAIDLRFEQHCDGNAAALYGEIHWDVYDTTIPPGPTVPPPAGLWEPAPGTTPASGNYVYLESQTGDYIGQGETYLYTDADAQFRLTEDNGLLDLTVSGSEVWDGEFTGPDRLSNFDVGYYGNLERYWHHNPSWGGMYWRGDRRGCDRLSGWFVVDSVTYDGPHLTAIDLRFEQHCEEDIPALFGEIHWSQ